MACGTNPLSWLKQKPYASINALCGFWSIEPGPGTKEPREMQDTYGMRQNHPPKPHLVPKLEDLLEALHPDILVIQTGSNLFGLFPDAKTVRRGQHTAALSKYLLPFKQAAIAPPSTLKKIYWVNPPTSGRVSKEVQDFLFEQTHKQLGSTGTVIDSRTLVAYPYQAYGSRQGTFPWRGNDPVGRQSIRDHRARSGRSAAGRTKTVVRNSGAPLVAEAVTPLETPARAEPVAPMEIARANR